MSNLYLPDAAATVAYGRELARSLKAGDSVALVGNLGAGKTHLTQGIAEGLGCEEPVTSPTFSLIQEYGGESVPLYHFDFYRLKSIEDLVLMGWDDYCDGSGVIVVEWADLFREAMPTDTIWLEIMHSEEGREVVRG